MKPEAPTPLRTAMMAFFTAHPDDEWLEYADLAIKFGATKDNMKKVVAQLRSEGLIERLDVVRLTHDAKVAAQAGFKV